jgi:hypothetical protein
MYLLVQVYSYNRKEILDIYDHDRFLKDLHFDHNQSTIITNEIQLKPIKKLFVLPSSNHF